jgi:hypothetical protein
MPMPPSLCVQETQLSDVKSVFEGMTAIPQLFPFYHMHPYTYTMTPINISLEPYLSPFCEVEMFSPTIVTSGLFLFLCLGLVAFGLEPLLEAPALSGSTELHATAPKGTSHHVFLGKWVISAPSLNRRVATNYTAALEPNSQIAVALWDDSLLGSNVSTGSILWQRPLDPNTYRDCRSRAIPPVLTIVGDVVAISCNTRIEGLDVKTGRSKWKWGTPTGLAISSNLCPITLLSVSGIFLVPVGPAPNNGQTVMLVNSQTGNTVSDGWSCPVRYAIQFITLVSEAAGLASFRCGEVNGLWSQIIVFSTRTSPGTGSSSAEQTMRQPPKWVVDTDRLSYMSASEGRVATLSHSTENLRTLQLQDVRPAQPFNVWFTTIDATSPPTFQCSMQQDYLQQYYFSSSEGGSTRSGIPTAVGNRTEDKGIVIGVSNCVVFALRADNGSLAWSEAYPLQTFPALIGDLIYLFVDASYVTPDYSSSSSGSTSGTATSVVALNISTGARVWHSKPIVQGYFSATLTGAILQTNESTVLLIRTSPISNTADYVVIDRTNGEILVHSGSTATSFVGINSNSIIAVSNAALAASYLNLNQWFYPLDTSNTVVTFQDGIIFVAGVGQVMALDFKGMTIWSTPLGMPRLHQSPQKAFLFEGFLIVSYDTSLEVFDSFSGDFVRSVLIDTACGQPNLSPQQDQQILLNSFVLHHRQLIFFAGTYCMYRLSADLRLSSIGLGAPFGGRKGPVMIVPLPHHRVLIASTQTLYLVNVIRSDSSNAGLALGWTSPLTAPAIEITSCRGFAVIATESGINVLSLTNGAPRWSFPARVYSIARNLKNDHDTFFALYSVNSPSSTTLGKFKLSVDGEGTVFIQTTFKAEWRSGVNAPLLLEPSPDPWIPGPQSSATGEAVHHLLFGLGSSTYGYSSVTLKPVWAAQNTQCSAIRISHLTPQIGIAACAGGIFVFNVADGLLVLASKLTAEPHITDLTMIENFDSYRNRIALLASDGLHGIVVNLANPPHRGQVKNHTAEGSGSGSSGIAPPPHSTNSIPSSPFNPGPQWQGKQGQISRWEIRSGIPQGISTAHSAATWSNGTMSLGFFVTQLQKISCYNQSDGTILWTAGPGLDLSIIWLVAASLHGGSDCRLYGVGQPNTLFALDCATGFIKWVSTDFASFPPFLSTAIDTKEDPSLLFAWGQLFAVAVHVDDGSQAWLDATSNASQIFTNLVLSPRYRGERSRSSFFLATLVVVGEGLRLWKIFPSGLPPKVWKVTSLPGVSLGRVLSLPCAPWNTSSILVVNLGLQSATTYSVYLINAEEQTVSLWGNTPSSTSGLIQVDTYGGEWILFRTPQHLRLINGDGVQKWVFELDFSDQWMLSRQAIMVLDSDGQPTDDLSNATVIVISYNSFYAIDAATGGTLWTAPYSRLTSGTFLPGPPQLRSVSSNTTATYIAFGSTVLSCGNGLRAVPSWSLSVSGIVISLATTTFTQDYWSPSSFGIQYFSTNEELVSARLFSDLPTSLLQIPTKYHLLGSASVDGMEVIALQKNPNSDSAGGGSSVMGSSSSSTDGFTAGILIVALSFKGEWLWQQTLDASASQGLKICYASDPLPQSLTPVTFWIITDTHAFGLNSLGTIYATVPIPPSRTASNCFIEAQELTLVHQQSITTVCLLNSTAGQPPTPSPPPARFMEANYRGAQLNWTVRNVPLPLVQIDFLTQSLQDPHLILAVASSTSWKGLTLLGLQLQPCLPSPAQVKWSVMTQSHEGLAFSLPSMFVFVHLANIIELTSIDPSTGRLFWHWNFPSSVLSQVDGCIAWEERSALFLVGELGVAFVPLNITSTPDAASSVHPFPCLELSCPITFTNADLVFLCCTTNEGKTGFFSWNISAPNASTPENVSPLFGAEVIRAGYLREVDGLLIILTTTHIVGLSSALSQVPEGQVLFTIPVEVTNGKISFSPPCPANTTATFLERNSCETYLNLATAQNTLVVEIPWLGHQSVIVEPGKNTFSPLTPIPPGFVPNTPEPTVAPADPLSAGLSPVLSTLSNTAVAAAYFSNLLLYVTSEFASIGLKAKLQSSEPGTPMFIQDETLLQHLEELIEVGATVPTIIPMPPSRVAILWSAGSGNQQEPIEGKYLLVVDFDSLSTFPPTLRARSATVPRPVANIHQQSTALTRTFVADGETLCYLAEVLSGTGEPIVQVSCLNASSMDSAPPLFLQHRCGLRTGLKLFRCRSVLAIRCDEDWFGYHISTGILLWSFLADPLTVLHIDDTAVPSSSKTYCPSAFFIFAGTNNISIVVADLNTGLPDPSTAQTPYISFAGISLPGNPRALLRTVEVRKLSLSLYSSPIAVLLPSFGIEGIAFTTSESGPPRSFLMWQMLNYVAGDQHMVVVGKLDHQYIGYTISNNLNSAWCLVLRAIDGVTLWNSDLPPFLGNPFLVPNSATPLTFLELPTVMLLNFGWGFTVFEFDFGSGVQGQKKTSDKSIFTPPKQWSSTWPTFISSNTILVSWVPQPVPFGLTPHDGCFMITISGQADCVMLPQGGWSYQRPILPAQYYSWNTPLVVAGVPPPLQPNPAPGPDPTPSSGGPLAWIANKLTVALVDVRSGKVVNSTRLFPTSSSWSDDAPPPSLFETDQFSFIGVDAGQLAILNQSSQSTEESNFDFQDRVWPTMLPHCETELVLGQIQFGQPVPSSTSNIPPSPSLGKLALATAGVSCVYVVDASARLSRAFHLQNPASTKPLIFSTYQFAVVADSLGNLYGLDLSTPLAQMDLLWTIQLGYATCRQYINVYGDYLFVTSDSTLLAFDRRTGKPLWQWRSTSVCIGPIEFWSGRLLTIGYGESVLDLIRLRMELLTGTGLPIVPSQRLEFIAQFNFSVGASVTTELILQNGMNMWLNEGGVLVVGIPALGLFGVAPTNGTLLWHLFDPQMMRFEPKATNLAILGGTHLKLIDTQTGTELARWNSPWGCGAGSIEVIGETGFLTSAATPTCIEPTVSYFGFPSKIRSPPSDTIPLLPGGLSVQAAVVPLGFQGVPWYTPAPTLPRSVHLPDLGCRLSVQTEAYSTLQNCLLTLVFNTYDGVNGRNPVPNVNSINCSLAAAGLLDCTDAYLRALSTNCPGGVALLKETLTDLSGEQSFNFCSIGSKCSDGEIGQKRVCQAVRAMNAPMVPDNYQFDPFPDFPEGNVVRYRYPDETPEPATGAPPPGPTTQFLCVLQPQNTYSDRVPFQYQFVDRLEILLVSVVPPAVVMSTVQDNSFSFQFTGPKAPERSRQLRGIPIDRIRSMLELAAFAEVPVGTPIPEAPKQFTLGVGVIVAIVVSVCAITGAVSFILFRKGKITFGVIFAESVEPSRSSLPQNQQPPKPTPTKAPPSKAPGKKLPPQSPRNGNEKPVRQEPQKKAALAAPKPNPPPKAAPLPQPQPQPKPQSAGSTELPNSNHSSERPVDPRKMLKESENQPLTAINNDEDDGRCEPLAESPPRQGKTLTSSRFGHRKPKPKLARGSQLGEIPSNAPSMQSLATTVDDSQSTFI